MNIDYFVNKPEGIIIVTSKYKVHLSKEGERWIYRKKRTRGGGFYLYTVSITLRLVLVFGSLFFGSPL